MEQKGIDELLSDEPVEEAVAETPQPEATEEQPTEAQAEDGQPRTPDGKFAAKQTGVEEPKVETPEAEAVPPTADQLPRDVYEPLKAVRAENKELKQRLEAFEQQLARQQVQPPQQAQKDEPPVDFWDNPQAFMATQMEQFGQTMMQRFQQQQQVERIEASETAAKAKYTDYGDAFRAFQQAAYANPSLVQQMTAAADPAEFAYAKGKSALELEKYGSVDELLKAERAKWEGELKAAAPAPQQTFPQTTAADGSVGARTGPAWSGPPSMTDLLG